MIQEHVAATNSVKGKEILDHFQRLSAEIQKDHSARLQAVC